MPPEPVTAQVIKTLRFILRGTLGFLLHVVSPMRDAGYLSGALKTQRRHIVGLIAKVARILVQPIIKNCQSDLHMQTSNDPDFEFLLFEGFSNIVLSCAMEPLRDARLRSGRHRANWVVSTTDGLPVRSSSGLQIVPDRAFDAKRPGKRLVLVAGYGVRGTTNRALNATLRSAARHCEAIVAVDSAAWLLAGAGVLDGRKATIHWHELKEFAEAFPNVTVLEDRFVKSGTIYSCGGASTVLDLMFEILSGLFGPETAFEASNMFLYSGGTKNAPPSNPNLSGLAAPASDILLAAIDFIAASLASPTTVADIAHHVDVSERTLNRIFMKELQTTPGKFIVRYRLKHAKYLSEQTDFSIGQIALRCGYCSAPSLCRAYKTMFGETLRAPHVLASRLRPEPE